MYSKRPVDDDHFRNFAGILEKAIAKYDKGDDEDQPVVLQKQQVEGLVSLEDEFRLALAEHPQGQLVYQNFIKHICDVKKNILAARPYFRERQGVFTKEISKALKSRQAQELQKFHFNYEFVLFAMDDRDWTGTRIEELARRIKDLRWELVEMNLPLAISQARFFWSRTPKSHLTFMDLVQITSMGLMAGIDKFCLPYIPALFRYTVIGRMIGNLIEQYSETLVHFYPGDKRKIYRANKAASRSGGEIDFEKIAEAVNKEVDDEHLTTPAEIADLMAAASTVSADSPVQGPDDEEGGMPLDGFAADESTHPDVRVETHEAMVSMFQAIRGLSLLEQKLLKLRGLPL
jgi:DNA-directed RNA polymerase specialized sigma subunit